MFFCSPQPWTPITLCAHKNTIDECGFRGTQCLRKIHDFLRSKLVQLGCITITIQKDVLICTNTSIFVATRSISF